MVTPSSPVFSDTTATGSDGPMSPSQVIVETKSTGGLAGRRLNSAVVDVIGTGVGAGVAVGTGSLGLGLGGEAEGLALAAAEGDGDAPWAVGTSRAAPMRLAAMNPTASDPAMNSAISDSPRREPTGSTRRRGRRLDWLSGV